MINKLKIINYRKLIPYILFIVLTIFIIATFLIISNGYHAWGADFALYINQSKALLNGNVSGIHALNKFGLDNSTLINYSYTPEMFPWGWPILLMPALQLVGQDFHWLKLYVILFFLGVIFLVYFLYSKKISKAQCLMIAACIGINPILINYTKHILSEFPYIFFVLICLILHDSIIKSGNKSFGKLMLMTFLFFFASIIRTEGILLVIAVFITYFIHWIRQNNRREYLTKNQWIFTFFLGYLFFQLIYQIALPSGIPSHSEHLKFVSLQQVYNNFKASVNSLSYCFSSFFDHIFIFLTIPVVIFGIVSNIKKDTLIAIYLLLHLAILLIWPYHESRYVYMIIPFYYYFLVVSLSKLNIQISKIKTSFATVFLIIQLSFLGIDYYNTIIPQVWHQIVNDGPETPDAQDMFSFVRGKTKKEDVIVFFKPRAMTLYTNRKSLIVHLDMNKIKLKGNYLVLHKEFGEYHQMLSLSSNPPEWLELQFENSKFLIYKVQGS